MARKAHITHIQTGAERDAGNSGRSHNDVLDAYQKQDNEVSAPLNKDRDASKDKVYGPGAPDGMSTARGRRFRR